MRAKITLVFALIAIIVSVAAAGPAEAGTRIGGGIHYLRTLGDIKDSPEWDESAIGFMGSIVVTGQLLRVEGDLEFVPDFGGSGELMIQPQAYGMIGRVIYGGAGIGIGYIDGDFQSNPFYALRAGVDFFLGGLDLDVFASYRFQKANDLEALGSDDLNSITFGALLRFGS